MSTKNITSITEDDVKWAENFGWRTENTKAA